MEHLSWVMECQHMDHKDVGGNISEQNMESRNKLLCMYECLMSIRGQVPEHFFRVYNLTLR